MPQDMKMFILLLLSALTAFTVLALLPAGEASQSDPVYDVEVGADDYQDRAEPGDLVTFQVKITNTGNMNDSYELFFFKVGGEMSMMDWCSFVGPEDNTTDIISPGEWTYIDLFVEVPEFTPEQDDAMKGLYHFKVLAQSMSNGSVEDWTIFELEVEEFYNLRFWSDIPGKNGILNRNGDTVMTYTLNVRNLGNCQDDIVVRVPADEWSGEKKDWKVKFGTQTAKTVTLDSLDMERIIMTVFIDKNTDPGPHTLQVMAESQGDTVVYEFTTVYINLTKAAYGVKLEKFPTAVRKVNPSDEHEIEFKFTLSNTGNQDDTYTVDCETLLNSRTYKGWTMEFENKNDERVDSLSVPTDLKGNTNLYLSKNERVDITLYVVVARDEEEGEYDGIVVSATSDNDFTQMDHVFFTLTVILPNIRVSDHLSDFYIDPDGDIKEGDSIDIHLRLYNDGGDETGEFNVFFYNGKAQSPNEEVGEYIAVEKVENIQANSSTFIMVTWENITYGGNDIYVYADKPIRSGPLKTFMDMDMIFSPDGLVLESRENDNTASIDDRYQEAIDLRPDLEVFDVDFSTLECGENCTVTVYVENRGSAPALTGSATVRLKIGGEAMKGIGSNSYYPVTREKIPVDDFIMMQFYWHIPDEPNNYTVRTSVDCYDDTNSLNCGGYRFHVQTYRSDDDDEHVMRRGEAIAYSILSLIGGIFLGGIVVLLLVERAREPGSNGKWMGGTKNSKSDIKRQLKAEITAKNSKKNASYEPRKKKSPKNPPVRTPPPSSHRLLHPLPAPHHHLPPPPGTDQTPPPPRTDQTLPPPTP